MPLKRISFVIAVIVLAAAMDTSSSAQSKPKQPSLSFGMAEISLGMTLEEVTRTLSDSGLHLQFLPNDKENASVIGLVGGDGQVTFSAGRAIYAAYQMPFVKSADELTQEIAAAVDSMQTKTCYVHNYSSHGTGGGMNKTIFECASRRFTVVNGYILGGGDRFINVSIEIGSTLTK